MQNIISIYSISTITNKLNLFAYMSQLKYAMEIESKICKSQNNEKKFAKNNFVYENM